MTDNQTLRHTVGRLAPSFALQAHRITAINREIPAEFPQIRLRRTSVNRIRYL